MKISDNIKNFRIFRNIKQQELADALGKSKSVISNWERGENAPDVESCQKLCQKIQQSYRINTHDCAISWDFLITSIPSGTSLQVSERT